MENTERPIRVTLIQPSLAKYRVPVYRELAQRNGIDLRLVYGVAPGIPNVAPEGFDAIALPRWQGKVAGSTLMFQRAEWTYSTRRYSDVVIYRWSSRSLTLLPALMRARANGVATVLWGHGYSKNERGWQRAARNAFARQASAVLFYEPRTRDRYVRNGWDANKMFVAINSLDHTDIERARNWWLQHPDELANFRGERQLHSGPVILFVSRLHPPNHLEWLIQATAQLKKDFPGLKTVIIGNGAEEREKLKSLSHELDAQANVIFHDGIYDEMKLAPWFLSADVIGYPSNIGLSLIHSFWYGVPVVSSDKLEIHGPEVFALENGCNGLTYEHGNVGSLTAALRQIIADRALRDTMSQAARRTVEGRFTIQRMVDGIEAAIRYARGTLHTAGNDDGQRIAARQSSYVPTSCSAEQTTGCG